jgi:hypothetical protein
MTEPVAQTVHVAQTAPASPHVATANVAPAPVANVVHVAAQTAPVVEEKPVVHKEVWKGPIPPHTFANGHTFHGWNPPKK